jgi:peptidoglycan/LPS O-acetylase OafA/YrhL
MRLLHRDPEVERDERSERDHDRDATTVDDGRDRMMHGRRRWRRDPDADAVDDRTAVVERPRRVRRERVHRPFHIGNILAIIGGAALAVIGIVALVRGDLNDTWDEPVTTVLRIDHTPLLAAIEVGAGALLVLFGLTARRFLALLASVTLAVGAAVAAIEPGRLATQYALEEWWAWTVAGGAAFVALVCMLPGRRRRVDVDEPVLAERQPA